MPTLGEQTLVYLVALAIVSFVLAAFTVLLPRPDNKQKQKSSIYFRYFLTFTCLAYFAFCLQLNGQVVTAMVGNNLLLLASSYALMLAVFHRFELVVYKYIYLVAALQSVLIVVVQMHLLASEQHDIYRDLVLCLNLMLPLGMTMWQLHSQFHLRSHSERIVFTSLWLFILALAGALYLAAAMKADHETIKYTVYFIASLLVECLAFLGFSLSIIYSLVGKLRQQIITDRLTGAKNRNYFYDIAEKVIAKVKRHDAPASLIICDIDHFKSINDNYGHIMGDEVLKQFSTMLLDALRIEDSLIRIGGEEFVILCPDIGLEGARLLAERLKVMIAEHRFEHDKIELKVTASFGVTNVTAKLNIDKIVHNADKALYKSKEQGRNRVNVFVY